MARLLALTQNSTEMANWCWNNVTFEGPRENLQQLLKIFKDMETRAIETGMGVVPIIQDAPEDGYFFNISVEDENVNEESEVDNPFIQIRYDTKWNANPENVKWLALKFAVDFVQEAEESGNKIYEHYRLNHGDVEEGEEPILERRFLTDEEFDSCYYLTNPEETETHDHGTISDEEWERLIDEEDWSTIEDYEKLDDTIQGKEWENVN